MVLLDEIVEILGLRDLDARFALGVNGIERGKIGVALVDGYCLGDTVLGDRFLKETLCCNPAPLGAQQKIDGVAVLIDGPVLIFPFTLDADVSLVHSPARADGSLVAAKRLLQYRQQLDCPAVHG